MRTRHLLPTALFASFLPVTSALACTKDTDCKGDRICVEGSCTAPSSSAPAASTSPPMSTPVGLGVVANPRTAFHLNLLGLLQFGVTPTVEMGGDRTLLLRARLLNTGLLPYLIAADDDSEFKFGLALGGQGRSYFAGRSQQGPYLGGGLELMYTNAGDTDSSDEYVTYSVIPQIEAGVRWDYPGYLLGVGAFMGAAIPISTSGYDSDEAETILAAGLNVDIGWYL
jgi:hypothetical protein